MTKLGTQLATRLAGGAASGVGGTADDIGNILGALTFAEYRASDRNSPASVNPRISIAAGGGIDSWPEEYGRNAALTQLTAQTARQPALGAASFNSRPGVTFDGVANYLAATLSPTVATGSRLYWWITFGWHGTPAASDTVLELATSGNSTRVLVETGALAAAYGPYHNLTGTDDDNRTTYAMDTGVSHCLQGGTLTSTTNKFARDAVYINGQGTDVLTAGASTNLFLGGSAAAAPGARFAPIVVQQLVIAHNTASITSLPTAQQIADVAAILMSRGGL